MNEPICTCSTSLENPFGPMAEHDRTVDLLWKDRVRLLSTGPEVVHEVVTLLIYRIPDSERAKGYDCFFHFDKAFI